jgi:hypothetical protein
MKYVLILLAICSSLFSANILSYNIYDRTDRVDIMFTFDTPFSGSITQKRQNDKIIIKLDESSIESPKIKNIASNFISKLTIAPIENEVQVIAKAPNNVNMQASKTADGYGLRLRFMQQEPDIEAPVKTAADLGNLASKPETEISTSYMIVIALLLLSIAVMLIFKRRLGNLNLAKGSKTAASGKKLQEADDVAITFQKSIDVTNKVVMLEYGEESYLVLLGSSNLLLDRFSRGTIKTQNEFDDMLDSKHLELDAFLKIKKESEAFQSYKEKASGLDIDDIELEIPTKL